MTNVHIEKSKMPIYNIVTAADTARRKGEEK
jgi:hypothetical protein